MAAYEDPDDWELVNDDGFVYKRKKRPRLDPGPGPSSSAQHPPDPAVERRHRRERKKKTLLKLRDRYVEEIKRWELLSNMLKQMEQSAQAKPQERHEPVCPTSSSERPSEPEDSSRREALDDLLAQIEAQEAVIRNVSNLCDVAEALCSAQEERLKQQLTDLPIWEPSPGELMAALGEQLQ